MHDAGPKALVEFLHLSESIAAKSRLQELSYTWNGRRFSFEVQFSRLSTLVIHRNDHLSHDFLVSPLFEVENDSQLPCGHESKTTEPSPVSQASDGRCGSMPGSRCMPGIYEENGVKQRHPNEINELNHGNGLNESKFENDYRTMNMSFSPFDRNDLSNSSNLNQLSNSNNSNHLNHLSNSNNLNNLNQLSNMSNVNNMSNVTNLNNFNAYNSCNNFNNCNSFNNFIDPNYPAHPIPPSYPVLPSQQQGVMQHTLPWKEPGTERMEQGAGCLRQIVIEGFTKRVPMRFVIEYLPGIQVVEARYVEGVYGFSLWIVGKVWWSSVRLMTFFETHPLDGMILFLRESSFVCNG